MKERIQRAAIAVLAEKGYGATSMRMIADRGDIAVGSIYVHYKGKKGLLDSLFKEAFEKRARYLGELEDAPMSCLDKLTAFVTFHFNELATDEALATVLIRESQNPELTELEGVRHFVEQLPGAIEGLLEEGVEKGTIRRMDTALVAHLIFHLIRSAVYERQLGVHHEREKIEDELKVFIVRAIESKEEESPCK